LTEPAYLPPQNFLGLEAERSASTTSRFGVLPVPYEQTTTFGGGTRNGPEAILRASREVEMWDDEMSAEPADAGVHTLQGLEPFASGPADMVGRIRAAVAAVDGAGLTPVVLGGEHTVSVGAVWAMAAKHRDLTAVILDAHADLRDEYQGTPLSHACASRRIAETCAIVQAGIRSLSREEAEFLREPRWPVVRAGEVHGSSDWMKGILDRVQGKPVYLSIDLDVFDPSIMPAVGTPEPDGLTWRQVVDFTAALTRHAPVVAFDVVELAPIPGFLAPDFLAARLIYRIMGQILAGEKGS
jgi:agmatinase